MQTLMIPSLLFRQFLRALHHTPQHTGWCRVGLYRLGVDTAWLARDLVSPLPGSINAVAPDLFWYLRLVTEPPTAMDMLVSPHMSAVAGALLIGDGPMRGALWGMVHTVHGSVPLEALRLVGAGMHHLLLTPRSEEPAAPAPSDPSGTLARTTIWSRTIGALGDEAVWQRLVGLRVTVVGIGRTGSLITTTLARLGLRALTLIDPDVVEAHNVGEMDGVTLDDVGRHKVDAVANTLRRYAVTVCTALPWSITADPARAACIEADVLVCCVDNDAARLAMAIYATLYHKVLLDLGTGIVFPASSAEGQRHRNRIMGADVRLILPGDGCLLCRGQLTAFAQAVADLSHPRPLEVQQDWRRQRAGSLRTLNQLAAALGVHMLQDLVAERLQRSTWAHLTFNAAGLLTVQYPQLPPVGDTAPCVLCARAGLGDAGLAWNQ